MKYVISCVGLALLCAPRLGFAAEPVDCGVKTWFSSQGSISKGLIEALGETKERLSIALYGFDNTDLGDELLKLAKKNITVRLKVDTARSAGKKVVALVNKLKAGGVQVQTVAPNGRNHNKFAIIDGKRVVTGSYNWTLKAEGNWENLLLLDCPELAKAYEREWESIR